jgi:hypothetical protein
VQVGQIHPTARAGAMDAARTIAAGVAAGCVAGLLVGGIGGRLAMLVLRLTSDPALRGLETDDGFVIGIVSTSTLFLLVLTTMLGALGGLAYLIVRSWLPTRTRRWWFGALAAAFGGAAIIRPGGIDFTRLEPLWLAIAMFVAIPAAGGVLISVLAERYLSPDSRFRRSRAAPAALIPIALFAVVGTSGISLALAVLAAILLWRTWPSAAGFWTSRPVTVIGRVALAAFGTWYAVALARDVAEVL